MNDRFDAGREWCGSDVVDPRSVASSMASRRDACGSHERLPLRSMQVPHAHWYVSRPASRNNMIVIAGQNI